jgi:hypothetical protein
MELDDGRTYRARRRQLPRLRIDEQRNATARRCQLRAGGPDRLWPAGHIESALGSQFGAPLRHEAAIRRPQCRGNRQHLRRHREFKVDAGPQGCGQPVQVMLLDMPPVFAQVHGDAVGTGPLGHQRRGHRIGFSTTAGLPQGGHVIDVHAQLQRTGLQCLTGRWVWHGHGLAHSQTDGDQTDGLRTSGPAAVAEARERPVATPAARSAC